jgi:dTDP-4-amino-4,6-dideoxygalactose transaminase
MCSAPDLLLEGLIKAGVEGGKWFDYPIAPRPDNPGSYNYEPGQCPIGEWVGQHMANLPLHSRLSDGDVDAVCSVLDDFISNRDGEPEFMAAAASGHHEPI